MRNRQSEEEIFKTSTLYLALTQRYLLHISAILLYLHLQIQCLSASGFFSIAATGSREFVALIGSLRRIRFLTFCSQLGYGTWQSSPGEVSVGVFQALKAGYKHLVSVAAECANIISMTEIYFP